jgi:Bacterial Ig-like domain (group 3)/FG-GAP-like repeat
MKRSLIVVAIVLFAVMGQAQPCPSVLWTSGVPAQGDSSSSVAVVDYDEDGTLDLVGVIGISNLQFVWWKGAGNLTFGPPTTIGTGTSMSNVVVADFTGDGRDDVAIRMGNPPNLVILPATGSGRGPAITKSWSYQYQLVAVNADADPAAELLVRDPYSFRVYDDVATAFTEVSLVWAGTGSFSSIASADFDADGKLDVAVSKNVPYGVFVYFGSAGGTFGAPVALPYDAPTQVAAGDLDNDGKPDLVAANWQPAGIYVKPRVSIYRHLGARTFTHSLLPVAKPGALGDPNYVVLRDVSGDGTLDLIAGVVNGSWITTAVGVGDGTFRTATFHQYYPSADPSYPIHPSWSTTADLNGDSRLDLVTAAYSIGPLPAAGSCATQLDLHSVSPVITVGHDAKLKAHVSGFGPDTSAPYGTVIFRKGATVLGSGPVGSDGQASITVSGLALGIHSLTAEFSGNASLASATSVVVKQEVTAATTQTILTLPEEPAVYGQPYAADIDIMGLGFTGPYGFVTVIVDGVETLHYTYYPFPLSSLQPGSHTLSVEYRGTHGNPASEAAPVTFVVGKATPLMSRTGAQAVRSGTAHSLTFQFGATAPETPGGSVQLKEGTAVLASGSIVAGSVTFNVTLGRGAHDVRAVYSGDDHYLEQTQAITLEVLPNLPFVIEARALPAGVHIAYVLPADLEPSTLWLKRRAAGTAPWQQVAGWNLGASMDLTVPSRGVVYEYQLTGFTNGGQSVSTDSEFAQLFEDDLLAAGMLVKRRHFSELRTAVNLLRAQANLSPFQFEASYNTSAIVRASHFTSLRTALTQARQVLGMANPALTSVSAGQTIRAAHIQELRELAR